MLVGGTALAGYYAGHRRSDDLDLFVRDQSALRAAVGAVEALTRLGAVLHPRQRTPQFYDATCELSDHAFTVQVVVDAPLHQVGQLSRAKDGVSVATLETLLKQKAATLVSRCSEKDLYDLQWLLQAHSDLKLDALVALGSQIDGGMTAESAVVSLVGATLRRAACDFSIAQDSAAVYQDITTLRKSLVQAFEKLARKEPIGAFGDLVRSLKT